MFDIGVISDTHDLLRPEAMAALSGVDLIIHAGDISSRSVIDQLEEFEAGGLYFYLLHEIGHLDIEPSAGDFQVVISGHSHKPRIERRDGVLFLNPGSAGPRRFSLPICLAKIRVDRGNPEPELIHLL